MKPLTNGKQNQQRHPTDGIAKRIQDRAYQRYVQRGQEPGHELEDWLLAERDIRGKEENQETR